MSTQNEMYWIDRAEALDREEREEFEREAALEREEPEALDREEVA